MTDPIKALADAARDAVSVLFLQIPGTAWDVAENLRRAIAAYDAAQSPPSDAEIDDWDARTMKWLDGEVDLTDLGKQEWQSHLDDAKRLMRRARPDAGLLKAAKAAIACVEWGGGMWGEPPVPCVRLSRERFEDLRAEVARVAERDPGVWDNPLKPSARLSRERFNDILSEVERQEVNPHEHQ